MVNLICLLDTECSFVLQDILSITDLQQQCWDFSTECWSNCPYTNEAIIIRARIHSSYFFTTWNHWICLLLSFNVHFTLFSQSFGRGCSKTLQTTIFSFSDIFFLSKDTPTGWLSGESVWLMTWWLWVRYLVEVNFLSGIFSPERKLC